MINSDSKRIQLIRQRIQQVIDYKPREVVLNEFAYRRMVNAYRDWLKEILEQDTEENKSK